MHTEYETTTAALPGTPYGKLFGVVTYREQLKPLCDSLAAVGVREIEILDGSHGIQTLLAWAESFSHYIFGQREADLLAGYLEAVRNDSIVFTAVVESGQENSAVDEAKAHGATELSHFGTFVVTSY